MHMHHERDILISEEQTTDTNPIFDLAIIPRDLPNNLQHSSLVLYFRCWLQLVHLTDLNVALQGNGEIPLWSREHWLKIQRMSLSLVLRLPVSVWSRLYTSIAI
jgi:hypothetical protein